MTKQSDKLPRIGIVTTRNVVERLNELCERYDMSQNRVIEALLVHLNEEGVNQAIESYKLTKTAEDTIKSALMKEVSDLSPEDLSKLISLIKSGNAPRV